MGAGLRIKKSFSRPSKVLVEGFKGLPVANIADMMNRTFCMNAAIKPVNEAPLLGVAFTVKTRPGDNLMLHKALDMAEPGDIIVVDASGDLTNSLMGELMVMWGEKKGIGGYVIDGAIRDYGALKNSDVPIYAAAVMPAGPYKDGPGEINFPISCGGVVVNPGDILVGDEDGVVVIRKEDAEAILKEAKAKNAAEQQIMKDIEELKWDRTWIDKALASKNCEFVD